MCLRATCALPSVLRKMQPVNSGLVRVMKSRVHGMLVASVGVMALVFTADSASAGARGQSRGAFASTTPHRLAAHMFRHHRRSQDAVVWPGDGFYYGPNGEVLDAVPPMSAEARNSNASDIPWDWAHRYPPVVTPSARPYVSSCGAETVTVPNGQGGTGQVNIIRCY